jgi:hypothetical protein
LYVEMSPFFFFMDLGLNSGLCDCKAGTLPLEPHLQSIFLWLFWRWGLTNYLHGLASNLSLAQPPKCLGLQVWATGGQQHVPFNKYEIFTWTLQLNTFTFTLLFGHHLPFGRQIFTKWRAKKIFSRSHNILNTIDNKTGLIESFSLSTELHNMHIGIKNICLEISLDLKKYY